MGLEKANHRVITSRLDWVHRIADEIRSLPLGSLDEFTADRRNIGAAESCLRKSIEALLDLGRHLLGKIFGEAVTEFKKIADELARAQVLTPESARQLSTLAGYSNRMVHFCFPREHRLRIRTNNALKCIIKEMCRRTRVVEGLPGWPVGLDPMCGPPMAHRRVQVGAEVIPQHGTPQRSGARTPNGGCLSLITEGRCQNQKRKNLYTTPTGAGYLE